MGGQGESSSFIFRSEKKPEKVRHHHQACFLRSKKFCMKRDQNFPKNRDHSKWFLYVFCFWWPGPDDRLRWIFLSWNAGERPVLASWSGKVLVIGGDGGALRLVLKHPQKVWLVEIDEEVIKACEQYFPWLERACPIQGPNWLLLMVLILFKTPGINLMLFWLIHPIQGASNYFASAWFLS